MLTREERSDKAEETLQASSEAYRSLKSLKAVVALEKTAETQLPLVEKHMVAFVFQLLSACVALASFREIVSAMDKTAINAEERRLVRALLHAEATVAEVIQKSALNVLDVSPRVRAMMEVYRSEAARQHDFDTCFMKGLEEFRRAVTTERKWYIYEILRQILAKHAKWWGNTKYLVLLDIFGTLPYKNRLVAIAMTLPTRVCTKKRKAAVMIDLTKVKKACST